MVIVLGAAIGGAALWHFWPRAVAFYTDAESIREPLATASPRDILWQPPVVLTSPLNSTDDDYEPRLSNDGLTLYFVRGKAGHNAELFFARRTPDGWSDPQPQTELNSPFDDLGPEPSADGETMYFYSNRDGGLGGYDLWLSRRGHNGWQTPLNLGPAINSEFNDYGPAITPDGSVLYFASNRPQPTDTHTPDPNAWPATLREDLFRRTYDLYRSSVTQSGFTHAEPLSALNTIHHEGSPAVSPFGDFLYFASDRPAGRGGFDMYRCRRLRGQLGLAENLGQTVNTDGNELDPALSLGGYRLYFSSDRIAAGGVPGASRDYNLYQTTSREVFSELEVQPRSSIDWAALWKAAAPNLLFALLALLLLLLLLWLFRGMQGRRLSLLAKCVLGSLAAHLLLMLLFNVWEVAASLAGTLSHGRQGSIQVAIASPGTSGSLFSQIREHLTSVDVANVSPAPERAPSLLQSHVEEYSAQIPVNGTALEAMHTIQSTTPPSDATVHHERMLPSATPPIEFPLSATALTFPHLPVSQAQREADVAPHIVREAPTKLIRVAHIPSDLQPVSVVTEFAPIRAPTDALPSAVRSVVAEPVVGDAVIRPEVMREPMQIARTAQAAPPMATQLGVELGLPRESTVPPSTSEEHQSRATGAAPVSSTRAAMDIPPIADTAVQSVQLQPGKHGSQAAPSSLAALESLAGGDSPTAAPWPAGFALSAAGWIPAPAASSFTPNLETQSALPHAEGERPPFGENTASPRAQMFTDRGPAGRFSDFRERVSPQRSDNVLGVAGSLAPSVRALDLLVSGDPSLPDRAVPTPVAVATHRELQLALPAEESAPENPYVQRNSEARMDIVERMGGSAETEQAVTTALQWLASHQSRDGRWDADGFDRGCGACGGVTSVAADHALTGLSLLCFLGAGHTHQKDGPYRDAVQRALTWLLSQQRRDGDLRGEETMYSHGIATLALSEAYGMTGDFRVRDAVQRAADFIDQARNQTVGGWRYDPGQSGDTSVLGWQVMALRSASLNGCRVSPENFGSARVWLHRVSDRGHAGRYSYQPGRKPTPSMTAEGMFVQQLLGMAPAHPAMQGSVKYILQNLPNWQSQPNTYFWYYASLALFQQQGEAWERWNESLRGQLTSHQRKDGRAAGSWDPVGEWADVGGRVYQTALCTLMLEVYYRYLPLFSAGAPKLEWTEKPAIESIGTIHGTVTDSATARPLRSATVRLDLPDGAAVTATTEPDGSYVLDAPNVPEFFALSASHDGFIPRSANAERAQLIDGTLRVNFALDSVHADVLVMEAVPDVHHLGDDHFDGTINSQFQKRSEGASFAGAFELGVDRRPAQFTRGEVRLLAKGVQRRHRIVINGKTLDRRLDHAPEDGSFGEFAAPFDASQLLSGANTLEIIAAPSTSDIDDFEFVNVQIHLHP